MVGGRSDPSIPGFQASDFERATKVVRQNIANRSDTGINNPANLPFPETENSKKPPSQSQTATVAQGYGVDYEERNLSDNPETIKTPLDTARKASGVWGALSSNSSLLDEEENPEAA